VRAFPIWVIAGQYNAYAIRFQGIIPCDGGGWMEHR
jgi:hypothetical protein